MSYDIIYGKQFVKLRRTGEVIVMLLAGSNNCYEIGYNGRNGRRTRSWDNLRYYNRKGKISDKPEFILKNLDAELRRLIRRERPYDDPKPKPADIKAHFGYYASIALTSKHTTSTTWDSYRNLFANGIKKALTIEELAALGVHLYFNKFSGDSPNGEPKSQNLTTELEYFAELKKWREWHEKHGKMFYLSFSPSDTDRVLERLRAPNRKSPREKTRVEQDHYFVLSSPEVNLVKYTSRGFRYSWSNTGGKQFRTEQEAEKYRQQLVKNGRYKAEQWKVKRVDNKTTFMVAA